MDDAKNFRKELLIAIVLFIIALIIIIILTLGWLAVFGIPIGLFLISLSIWYFVMWFYKKKISIRAALILFLLPLLAVISFIFENGAYVWEQSHIPLGQARVTQPYPFWVMVAPFVSLLSWIIDIALIVWFFVKVKKL